MHYCYFTYLVQDLTPFYCRLSHMEFHFNKDAYKMFHTYKIFHQMILLDGTILLLGYDTFHAEQI